MPRKMTDFEKRLDKLVQEKKITPEEAQERLRYHLKARKEDVAVQARKKLEAKKLKASAPKSQIDLILWPVIFVLWIFTAQNWLWTMGIISRTLYWWTQQKGKEVAKKTYSKKVPDQVRTSLQASIASSMWIWMAKAIFALIVALNFFKVSKLFGVLALVLTLLWLRKPAQPRYQNDGTLLLPRPYMLMFFGGYLSGFFQAVNEVGSKGIKLGSKIGPIDKRTNFIPGKITQADVNDTFLGWIMGAVDLTIKDSGGHKATVKVARWLPPDEMEDLIRKATGIQRER